MVYRDVSTVRGRRDVSPHRDLAFLAMCKLREMSDDSAVIAGAPLRCELIAVSGQRRVDVGWSNRLLVSDNLGVESRDILPFEADDLS